MAHLIAQCGGTLDLLISAFSTPLQALIFRVWVCIDMARAMDKIHHQGCVIGPSLDLDGIVLTDKVGQEGARHHGKFWCAVLGDTTTCGPATRACTFKHDVINLGRIFYKILAWCGVLDKATQDALREMAACVSSIGFSCMPHCMPLPVLDSVVVVPLCSASIGTFRLASIRGRIVAGVEGTWR